MAVVRVVILHEVLLLQLILPVVAAVLRGPLRLGIFFLNIDESVAGSNNACSSAQFPIKAVKCQLNLN